MHQYPTLNSNSNKLVKNLLNLDSKCFRKKTIIALIPEFQK